MVDDNTPAEADTVEKAPVGGEAGNAGTNTEAPKNFKYKTQEEAEKAYSELEKKLGEQSKDVEEARKLKEQVDPLLRAVWNNPTLYRQVEGEITKLYTGELSTEGEKETDKGGEEPKKSEVNPQVTELRTAEENRVLGEFYSKYGYTKLSDKERKNSQAQLVTALAELVDPGGKKPIRQIFAEIPVSKLGRFLEYAHFIANKDKLFEQAKNSALLSQRENEAGSIGSFSASSGQSKGGVTLTNRQREMARKMGISEEAYAKNLAKIAEEAKEFER